MSIKKSLHALLKAKIAEERDKVNIMRCTAIPENEIKAIEDTWVELGKWLDELYPEKKENLMQDLIDTLAYYADKVEKIKDNYSQAQFFAIETCLKILSVVEAIKNNKY